MGKLKSAGFTYDPAEMVEKTIGSFIIEPGDGDVPDPIFWSMACRQLGIPSEAQQRDGSIRARLPVMPRQTYETVLKRALFLAEREEKGLPTEQLPSGRWPDSLDEFADQVPVAIAQDEKTKSVYIDFGRPIQAIGVSPAMARTIATMIMTAANELDPEGTVATSHPELLNVARLRVPEQDVEQEGTVMLPGVFNALKLPEEPVEQRMTTTAHRRSISRESFPLVGICAACGEPQYMTPAGEACNNGHGGAETMLPCHACVHRHFESESIRGHCGAGHDPRINKDHNCADWKYDDEQE